MSANPPQLAPQVSEILLRDMMGNDLARIEKRVDGVLTIRERRELMPKGMLLAALYDAAHAIETTIRELQGER